MSYIRLEQRQDQTAWCDLISRMLGGRQVSVLFSETAGLCGCLCLARHQESLLPCLCGSGLVHWFSAL